MGRAAGNRDSWWGLAKDRHAAQVAEDIHQREDYIPFEPVIVAATDDYLIVDKPPFLPATPNGRIEANTVQERLRKKLDEPEIVAVHRLDLLTSGLMLLSRNPATRAAYQQLFQNREIEKEYECLTVMPDDWAPGETREVELWLHDNPGRRGVTVVPQNPAGATGAAGAEETELAKLAKLAKTTVTFVGPVAADISDVLGNSHGAGCSCGACGSVMQVGHWRLQPHTGRTHQLRATMNWLDYPILGEDTYGSAAGNAAVHAAVHAAEPRSLPLATTSSHRYTPQLRLLATSLSFTDPVTGEKRTYRTAMDVAARVEPTR